MVSAGRGFGSTDGLAVLAEEHKLFCCESWLETPADYLSHQLVFRLCDAALTDVDAKSRALVVSFTGELCDVATRTLAANELAFELTALVDHLDASVIAGFALVCIATCAIQGLLRELAAFGWDFDLFDPAFFSVLPVADGFDLTPDVVALAVLPDFFCIALRHKALLAALDFAELFGDGAGFLGGFFE